MKQHFFRAMQECQHVHKVQNATTTLQGGALAFLIFLHLFYNLIRNHGERTPQDTNCTSLMLYRHRFSFQASLNWNPRISSSSSKVKVISMSNSPSGCSWISDGSGTSGCLILMAFNSANFDLGMSSSLQSSRSRFPWRLRQCKLKNEWKNMEK